MGAGPIQEPLWGSKSSGEQTPDRLPALWGSSSQTSRAWEAPVGRGNHRRLPLGGGLLQEMVVGRVFSNAPLLI